jgi:GT2 family glycosyltransferase
VHATPLSIIILHHNRKAALRRTLIELASQGLLDAAQIIVVDNASSDDAMAMVREDFPEVQVVALGENVGVAGFNRGAERATRDRLLILDDDSWPDEHSLEQAMRLLDERPAVAAVALLPVHPKSRKPEWPQLTSPQDDWPVMGCANLVRTKTWREVGGYEETFFLYRNDTDLAMKILALGGRVAADPAWFAWHDSPAAARKSERWLHLATRNWVWLARRHGRGLAKPLGILAAVVWAFVLAGLSRVRLAAVLRGAHEGMLSPRPPLPRGLRTSGDPFARLLRLQFLAFARR